MSINVNDKNIGHATAYAYAVAGGYTGTEAAFTELLGNIADDLEQIENLTVTVETLAAGSSATASYSNGVLHLGIPKGDKGDKGNTGNTPALTIGTVTTLSPDDDATAAITGTAENPVLSLGIPQGKQGEVTQAEFDALTDDVAGIEAELKTTSPYNIVWQQGGLNTSGVAINRTNRIRTTGYITIENDSIFVEIPSGFKYAIHAYDSAKTRIGYIPNRSDIITDRKATYKVSDFYDNAVYFRMWVAYTDDADILPTEGDEVTVAPFESVIASLKSHVLKSVRILGVGNSYTRDSIRWLCKILKESGYDDVIVGHGYLGASTLAEQYASLDSSDSNHSAFEYWKYNNTKNATKTSGKTLDEIFTDEPWDIVVFQQQSDESGQYASYVSSSFDINDFITYISGKVSNADIKYGLMMPWSHADGYDGAKFAEYYNSDPKVMLDAIKTVIPQVADHMSQCDYVVNAGEAIDLGRQNSYLNALGDQMLRTDKNHLYYGIPSYMVGLVYALTLCDVNLNNVMWYPTATDEGQTGITTSGYLAYLAKQCAETAVNGYVLADDISELKEDLTQKANQDGYYADLVSGGSTQLLSDMVETDTTPYNYRTAGGSLEIGDRMKLKKIVGGSLAVNQLVLAVNATSEVYGITRTANATGTELTYTGTSENNTNYTAASIQSYDFVAGHKYYLTFGNVTLPTGARISVINVDKATECVCVMNSSGFGVNINTGVECNFTVKPMAIDITRLLGTTIADYVNSLESGTAGAGVAWLKAHFPKIFDSGYIPYNAGTLEHVSGLSAHKMTGFNQWDEEWEVGSIDASGNNDPDPSRIRSKNYTAVLPNTNYYFNAPYTLGIRWYAEDKSFISGTSISASSTNKVMESPSNACYLRFSVVGTTTYNHDICINLHWDGERDGEYEPYEEHSYPLDSDVTLRGIPKLDANNSLYYDGDEYASDGTVTKNFANKVFVGAAIGEYWILQSINEHDIANFGIDLRPDKYITGVSPENIIRSNWYGDKVQTTLIANVSEEGILFASGDTFYVRISKSKASTVDEFKAYLAEHPLEIVYKLATPTTESADPYTEIQNVSNWGTEEFVSESIVPVGHETAYQPDLRAKIEVAPESPDTDGMYLMKRENGQNSYVAYLGELPSDPSEDGSYYLKATRASGVTTLSWEAQT